MVRGVGFEPTKAYATGFPRSRMVLRDHLSLAPRDFTFVWSCPLDLVPAWLACLARDSGTPASNRDPTHSAEYYLFEPKSAMRRRKFGDRYRTVSLNPAFFQVQSRQQILVAVRVRLWLRSGKSVERSQLQNNARSTIHAWKVHSRVSSVQNLEVYHGRHQS